MTTHVLNGISLVRDTTQPGDPLVAAPPATLTVVVPDGVTTFSYSIVASNPGDLPEVDISATEILTAINSLTETGNTSLGLTTTAFIGQITWNGNVTQLLGFDANGTGFDVSNIFVIGGAPLPALTTLAQVQAFEASITSIGAIPGGHPLGAGQTISFASLSGVSTLSDNFVNGTNGNDTLFGTAGNDVFDPMSNDGDDVIYGSAGNDVMNFSNLIPGTLDFYTVTYSGLSAGITAFVDSLTATTTVDKGVNGTDNLVDALMAMNWNYGDGMWIAGTNHNDTFDINLDVNTWLGVQGGAGVDAYNIRTDSIVRIAFESYHGLTAVTQGANINMVTGAVANDGHGNAEQINILNANARIEIEGTRFDDTITGSNRDERFILRQGADTLDAGGGWDMLRYDRNGVGSIHLDLGTGMVTGNWFGQTFTHQVSNIEEVRGSRDGDDFLGGDNFANRLDGRGGDDTLFGSGGDDTLIGREGDDRMDGGAGIDTAQLNSNDFEAFMHRTANGVMVQSNDGIDILTNVEGIQFWNAYVGVSTLAIQSNTATASDDILIGAAGGSAIDGLGGNDRIFGLEGNDSLTGGLGDDSLRGHAGNDTLLGGDGNDTLIGDDGDDYLNPGENNEGWDYIQPGRGNDTVDMGQIVLGWVSIVHDGLDAGIVATLDGAANTGSINKGANGMTTLLDVVNPMNYWGLNLEGTAYDDTFNVTLDPTKYQWLGIRGGAGNNTINIGGGSSDGNLRLDYSGASSAINADLSTGIIQNGQGGTDTITGSGSRIELRGSNNTDTIMGSSANERFILRQGNDILDAAGGWDVLRYDRGGVTAVNANLATGVATGLWFGQAFTHAFSNVEEVRGSLVEGDTLTGDLNANRLDGRGGNDTLDGGAGNDTLLGGDGDDSLVGGAGHDELHDGSGNDSVSGGDGNDLFVQNTGQDTFDGGAGLDSLLADLRDGTFAPQSFQVEVDLLLGDAGAVGNPINRDLLISIENYQLLGDFDAYVFGDTANNLLRTDLGTDTLNGWSGDDTLDGGAGADLMIGGQGSDTFYVDNAADRVGESRSWAGTDTVISSVDFRTGNRHIENVELTGTARIGAGNGLMNVITGNDVDNILDGGKNNDTLIGGLGNDTYLLRAPGDTIVEQAGQGIDVAKSYGSFALMAHVEKLFMQTVYSKTGSPVNFNGIGNGLDNTIIGTPFDNTIVGREGRDVLKGQAGDDTFVFDRALGADNVDRIIDFEVNGDNDTLKIKATLLGGAVSAGVLAAADFAAGTAAADASDRFVFDRASGQLWFDADGTGAAAQQLVATFEQNALVEADDILIF